MDLYHTSQTTQMQSQAQEQYFGQPTDNDVLCGRGGGINAHVGNIKFRGIIQKYKTNYILCKNKQEKANFSSMVLREIRSLTPPGRFLTRSDAPQDSRANSHCRWVEIEDAKAIQKISQALREGAPNIRSNYASGGIGRVNVQPTNKNKKHKMRDANPNRPQKRTRFIDQDAKIVVPTFLLSSSSQNTTYNQKAAQVEEEPNDFLVKLNERIKKAAEESSGKRKKDNHNKHHRHQQQSQSSTPVLVPTESCLSSLPPLPSDEILSLPPPPSSKKIKRMHSLLMPGEIPCDDDEFILSTKIIADDFFSSTSSSMMDYSQSRKQQQDNNKTSPSSLEPQVDNDGITFV